MFGYLLGSIPTGYLVGRRHGIDIREHGSGNIGATNVVRVLGKKPGYLVFFCDAIKGLLLAVRHPGDLWFSRDTGERSFVLIVDYVSGTSPSVGIKV